MKRRDLREGHPRRMSDARNAWKKMNEAQRLEFATWLVWDVEAPDLAFDTAAQLRQARAILARRHTKGEAR